MQKLTDTFVTKTEPGEKDVTIFDAEVPGFALKVTPFGTKSFFYQYWSPVERRKRRRYNLGIVGTSYKRPDGLTGRVTAVSARGEAERLRGIVKDRRDPFLEKRDDAREKEAEVLAERARVAALRSVRSVAALLLDHHASAEDKKSDRTIKEYTRLLDRHILSTRVGGKMFGDRPISDIGAADALAIRRQTYTVTVKRIKKGKPITITTERALSESPVLANRVQQLARSLINFSVGKGRDYGIKNPFGGKKWFTEKETRKALTTDEIAALHASLAVEDDGDRGGSVDAIKLLLYTGMRKNEALTLMWDDIDVDRGLVTLRNTKTGESVRPLNVEALAVLDAIPHKSAYVFPNPDDASKPRAEIKRTWLRVRARAGFTEPMHSLRNTMASTALMSGVPLAAVGTILGHVRPETTARYAKFGALAAKVHADLAGAALAPKVAKVPTRVTDINTKRKVKK